MAERLRLRGGGHLAYEVRGDGAPLLLCRWSVGSMALWRELAIALARRHRVIAFDPRGTGGSSDAPLQASTRALARDPLALLDALAIPRADVFGESLGGMTASWLAIDAPARLRRLVLASTLPEPLAISPRAAGRAFDVARCLAYPSPHALAHLVGAMASGPPRGWQRALEDDLRRAPMRRRNLLAIGIAALRHRAGPALHQARAPTLLLFGEDDPLVGAAARDELAHDRPDARVDVIAGAGHALTLERPREIAERVLAFLA